MNKRNYLAPNERLYASRKKPSNFSCRRSLVSASLRSSFLVGKEISLILCLDEHVPLLLIVSSELIVTRLLSFLSGSRISPFSALFDSSVFILVKNVSSQRSKFSLLYSELNSNTRSKFSSTSMSPMALKKHRHALA